MSAILQEVLETRNQGFTSLRDDLLARQHADGYWCEELECDVTPTADYILLAHFLGRGQMSAEDIAKEPRLAKAAAYILSKQGEDGGWPIYHGGPGEISATVKAYFALKLAGHPAENPNLQRAAQFVREHGGVVATNSFMKFYLALFGQWAWSAVPAMPPELFLLPQRSPFHIYAMSSWSRCIVIPMFLLFARRPKVELPQGMGVEELFDGVFQNRGLGLWRTFFIGADLIMKIGEVLPFKPWRQKAMQGCLNWILEREPKGQGLGSIWPAMVNAAMALSCEDFQNKAQVLDHSLTEIEALGIEDEETLRFQPCSSPIWDTAVAILALREAGVAADDTRLLTAGRWLLSKEVRELGDWIVAGKQVQPGGWYFQHYNEAYPDTDDTAMVLMALHTLEMGEEADAAKKRAVAWLLAMQNDDGGWGAFDRNNNRSYLTKVPFADHNAMIDPSSADVTARVLGALATVPEAPEQAARRAWIYLACQQETDGSWFGRWGVNHIYGSWSVSNAWRDWPATGVDLSKTLDWLRTIQNSDGGWGESPLSYDEPAMRGCGPSTGSQTAWALHIFFNAGIFEDEAVARGIAYLQERVRENSDEPQFTGTGFPKVFYLNYHLYRLAFPLMALARHENHRQEA